MIQTSMQSLEPHVLKVNHNIIMKILIALKVPQWLLRLLTSYLENRKMFCRFRGCSSSVTDIDAGFPQGTLIGGILYILLYTVK